MKKFYIIAGVILLVVLAGVIVLKQVDKNYGVIWSSPRVSHEKLATNNTSFRFVIKPQLAKEHFVKLLGEDSSVPAWSFGMVLPYETAMLAGSDADRNVADVMFFCNDKRLGPKIVEALNNGNAVSGIRGLDFSKDGFVIPERGVITLEGSAPLDSTTMNRAWDHWGYASRVSPLQIEGEHFAELVIDNRRGDAYVLLGSLAKVFLDPREFALVEPALKGMIGIAILRGHADFVGDDLIQIKFGVRCVTDSKEMSPQLLKLVVDAGTSKLATNLSENYRIVLNGSTRIDGDVLYGDYKLSKVSSYMASRLLKFM